MSVIEEESEIGPKQLAVRMQTTGVCSQDPGEVNVH